MNLNNILQILSFLDMKPPEFIWRPALGASVAIGLICILLSAADFLAITTVHLGILLVAQPILSIPVPAATTFLQLSWVSFAMIKVLTELLRRAESQPGKFRIWAYGFLVVVWAGIVAKEMDTDLKNGKNVLLWEQWRSWFIGSTRQREWQ